MSEEIVNIDNPMNHRNDMEERNAPHVTPIPAEAEADDLFDDGPECEPKQIHENENDVVKRQTARNPLP